MQAANGKPQAAVCHRCVVLSLLHLSDKGLELFLEWNQQEHAFLMGKLDKDNVARENEAFLWLFEKLARDYSSQSQNCLPLWN